MRVCTGQRVYVRGSRLPRKALGSRKSGAPSASSLRRHPGLQGRPCHQGPPNNSCLCCSERGGQERRPAGSEAGPLCAATVQRTPTLCLELHFPTEGPTAAARPRGGALRHTGTAPCLAGPGPPGHMALLKPCVSLFHLKPLIWHGQASAFLPRSPPEAHQGPALCPPRARLPLGRGPPNAATAASPRRASSRPRVAKAIHPSNALSAALAYFSAALNAAVIAHTLCRALSAASLPIRELHEAAR